MHVGCRHRTLAAVLVAVGITGCGGSGTPEGPSSPPPTPTPPPVTTVIEEGAGALESSTAAPVVFTTTRTGTLEAIVDWTFAENDLDLFLARGDEPCTLDTFNDRSCGFIATEESVTLKPERLRVTGLAAGTYSLYVANFGDTDDSISWQLLLTTVPGSAASRSVTAAAAGNKVPLVRMGHPR